jgi:TPR repeat protein
MYEVGDGVPQNYAVAASWFRKAADQGTALAQTRLGVTGEERWGN